MLAIAALVTWPRVRQATTRMQQQRARNDSEAIANALIRFYEDNAFFPLWAHFPNEPQLRRVDLLVSEGAAPAGLQSSQWIVGTTGSLADQLVLNTPGYSEREGPGETGWDGPYLRTPPGPDPWNHRYMVNVGLLSSGAPEDQDVAKSAVWVLSAGPNGIVETLYRQPISSAALGGDDIGFRVQ
jgi:hypothetical protein